MQPLKLFYILKIKTHTNKMKKLLTLGLIALSLSFSNVSNAQTKIGYISADEIMGSMPEAAKADSNLNQYQQALYLSAQDKQATLNEAVQKFYKDSLTMSAQLKEVKRKDLQEKIQELSGEEQKIQNLLEQKKAELLQPIQKRLQAAIQEVAKENGYAYVMYKESLIVYPSGDDLGAKVRLKLGIKDGTPKAPVKK
jgi:outer membrane protein